MDMPGSSQRVTRSASSKANKEKGVTSSSRLLGSSQLKTADLENGLDDVDYTALSSEEIINVLLERNTDPVSEKMMMILKGRMRQEVSDAVEKEKRDRSLVISGLAEWGMDKPLLQRQKYLYEQVADILDTLKVDCLPEVVYRMGKYSETRPRLVKVVLPSRSHWSLALSKAYLLRRTKYSNIYVRRSMTSAERKQEYELREQARVKNEGKSTREWVVYREELRHISDLPRRRHEGNH
ncbi:hypothetical protein Aduo_004635 [Ancylostoma duodenale]